MLANHRQNRENVSQSAHGSRRYSARASDKGSRYREKAQQYYTSFNGKAKPERALSSHHGEPLTPQQHRNYEAENPAITNFLSKNSKIDEKLRKLKGRKYVENDICEHLKIDKKQ